MPYKDKEKKKKYYERHQKWYHKEFIKKHRSEWNKYQREYNKRRRMSGEYNGWDIVKKDPIKKQKANRKSSEYWEANREVLKAKHREQSKNLEIGYVARQLARELGISAKTARKIQILVDIKKSILQIKQEIRWRQQKIKT